MGNVCVGASFFKFKFKRRSKHKDKDTNKNNHNTTTTTTTITPSPIPIQVPAEQSTSPSIPKPLSNPPIAEQSPPKPVTIPDPAPVIAPDPAPHKPSSKKQPHHVRRVSSAAGLQVDSVLRRKTENLKDTYTLGKKLGQGQFGTTYLCTEKATGKEYACKSILKRKLVTDEDVEDVRREIQIMHHLSGHPNVITICGAYEDGTAVHVVMELCAGGELFDRIIQKGHYTEKKAAELGRVIVGVVEVCHSLGVMHRDLKPENFLFIDQEEESKLKTIDFGLSIFFKPGT